MTDMVRVRWYEHSCEWISKYCDEHHERSALVPRAILEDTTADVIGLLRQANANRISTSLQEGNDA